MEETATQSCGVLRMYTLRKVASNLDIVYKSQGIF